MACVLFNLSADGRNFRTESVLGAQFSAKNFSDHEARYFICWRYKHDVGMPHAISSTRKIWLASLGVQLGHDDLRRPRWF
jgi:hypothetical protein